MSIERSQGRRRPRTPRPGDAPLPPGTALTAPQRDRGTGRFAPGNTAAKLRALKAHARKLVGLDPAKVAPWARDFIALANDDARKLVEEHGVVDDAGLARLAENAAMANAVARGLMVLGLQGEGDRAALGEAKAWLAEYRAELLTLRAEAREHARSRPLATWTIPIPSRSGGEESEAVDPEDDDQDESDDTVDAWVEPALPPLSGNSSSRIDLSPVPDLAPRGASATAPVAIAPSPLAKVVHAIRRVLSPAAATQARMVTPPPVAEVTSSESGNSSSRIPIPLSAGELAQRLGDQLEAGMHAAMARRRAQLAAEGVSVPAPAAPILPDDVLAPPTNEVAEREHEEQVAAWRARREALQLDFEGVPFDRRAAPVHPDTSPTEDADAAAGRDERTTR